MARLDGKVTIVTGAGGGIGRATALALSENGARVALTDRDADELAETVALVRDAGGDAVAVDGDIVDPATIDALTVAALDAFGHVDGLVNNAGIVVAKGLLEHTAEDFDRLMRVNCLSALVTTQRLVPEMRASGRGGSIVNISSIGGLVALLGVGVYCASKAAVIGLTRSIAYEFAPEIRCNAICPGGVDTPMSHGHIATFDDPEEALKLLTGRQMLKRHARPREIADAIVFLISDESSFMTGAAVPVEAGHSAS
ncbi:MAG TPA: SDR family oxidoreductase [Baekduia sp.]|nr:SDR family oxidoreductase [Baekduia sp.]